MVFLFSLPYAHQGTDFAANNISLAFFFSTLYVALEQKNLFPLEHKASKDSSIIFLSSCMMKGNYNLQQQEQVYNKEMSCLTPNTF